MKPSQTLRLLLLVLITAFSLIIGDSCGDAEKPAETETPATTAPDTVAPADTTRGGVTDTVSNPADTTKGGQAPPPR